MKKELKAFILKNRRIGYVQVLYTPRRIATYMFVMCFIFTLIGLSASYEYSKFDEVSFDYQRCRGEATEVLSRPSGKESGSIVSWSWDGTMCKIWLKVPRKMNPPVFIYYGLTDFYQNHRRYMVSSDERQLKGEYFKDANELDQNCEPLLFASSQGGRERLTEVKVESETYQVLNKAQIYPCGLKANSMFSDEISDELTCINVNREDGTGQLCTEDKDGKRPKYSFTEKNTAPPEHKDLYGNINWQDHFDSEVEFARTIVPPPLWRMSWRKWRDGYTFDNYPKLKDWERFQSWMDSAGLPEFWKLWGVNHTSSLLPGIWELSIEDNFSVSNFKGSKTIIISTGTALGAKNEFLKIAYFVCSGVFALTGVLISLKSLIWPRKYNRIDEPEEELIEEE